MPDDETGPCPECSAKVILNGGVAARVLDETCDAIYQYQERGGKFTDAEARALVIMANKLEDDVFRFQRRVLDSIGFKGPYSHALSIKP